MANFREVVMPEQPELEVYWLFDYPASVAKKSSLSWDVCLLAMEPV